MSTELTRSNKVTAYWEGDGVAVGVFYKTHTKLLEVRSNTATVAECGFVMPEGTDEAPVTAQDKLAAFKTFLQTNASAFGIQYDPVDRRKDEFKFPNKYDEETFTVYSKTMVEKSVGETLEKVQNNVINNLVKSGHLPAGTEVNYALNDNPELEIKEKYSNGNIKYADATYGIVIEVAGELTEVECTASVVSGQLKKPRELKAEGNTVVLTQTGVKTYLIEAGLLPKIEKEKKDEEAIAEDVDVAESLPIE